MMLNVSRAPVPESWLSTLATKPSLGYNSLDKEALEVTLEKSRFSVSTIDSELFPELLSWSALMNALPTSHRVQSIPSDIPRPDDGGTNGGTDNTDSDDTDIGDIDTADIDTILEPNSSLSLILDPTTLEVGFDQSCFDSLDDLLLHHPFEAFTEACWLDAVGPSSPTSTPTRFPNKPTGRRKLPSPPVTNPSSEKCDPDVAESLTYYKEERISTSTIGVDITYSASPLRTEQKSPWSTTDKKSFSNSLDDEATSFILFEAPSLAPNRYNSVGHFPMPSSHPHRMNVYPRIPTFCSNLPASWTSVR
ncbi:hypothetical protein BYT27DRAFT_7341300 [Phlegmacium glaucopus]|nr:hypothetical protein BYT27DRAFT_7341300 [Phlegmacium glaucopus]